MGTGTEGINPVLTRKNAKQHKTRGLPIYGRPRVIACYREKSKENPQKSGTIRGNHTVALQKK